MVFTLDFSMDFLLFGTSTPKSGAHGNASKQ